MIANSFSSMCSVISCKIHLVGFIQVPVLSSHDGFYENNNDIEDNDDDNNDNEG